MRDHRPYTAWWAAMEAAGSTVADFCRQDLTQSSWTKLVHSMWLAMLALGHCPSLQVAELWRRCKEVHIRRCCQLTCIIR